MAAVAAAGSVAAASHEVQYGPAPAWVKPPPAPTRAEPPAGAAARTIYLDWQTRIGKDQFESYTAYRIKVLKPEGLALGNLTGTWNPTTDELIVHKLSIVRDGKVIDVLATTKFRVLERADKLDYAVLDGALTAALQAPGLQVGDEIEFSATLRRRDATFAGRTAGAFQLPFLSTPGAYRLRLTWPKEAVLQWRGTPDLGALAVHGEGADQVLEEELQDPNSSPLTDGAPPRFNLRRRMEFSQFSSWDEIGQTLRPLFEQAATLVSQSPLHAEAARIAAATADPGARAEAALRLVQDRIRYVYVGLDGDGYHPATADNTWLRKFGDCKAKSVLLMALLRELGIDAEPVLVASNGGDGMDRILPTPYAFDHVLVRARIGGKSYWLDGTRLGDRRLDALPAPKSRWALAVRPGPTSLEPVAPDAPSTPQIGVLLEIDASAGFDAPAKVHVQEALRGDDVNQARTQLSGLAPDDAEREVKAFFRNDYPWVDVTSASWRYDEVERALVIDMTGEGRLDWDGDDKDGRSWAIPAAGFSPPDALHRSKEQDQAAPWLTDFPNFKRWTTVIRLPPATSKWAWAYNAAPVDLELGGVAYSREAEMRDGVVRTTMSRRTYLPEISSEQAQEIAARLPSFDNNISHVYQIPAAKAVGVEPPAGADGMWSDLVGEGGRLLIKSPAGRQQLTQLTQLKRALSLWGAGRQKDARALADATVAAADNPGVPFAAATAFAGSGEAGYALALTETGLKRWPAEPALLQMRALLRVRAKQYREALADADQAVRARPESRLSLLTRAMALAELGRADEALADLDEVRRMDPLDHAMHSERAKVLHVLGRDAEAVAMMDEWPASDDSGVSLNARCWTRAIGNMELAKAEADCAEAVKLRPRAPAFWDSYALVALRTGRLDDALARYDHALALAPKLAPSLYGRGITKVRHGDQVGGAADIAAAKAIDPEVDHELTRAGVTP